MMTCETEICSECGREIMRAEPACVFEGQVVCEACDRRLRNDSVLESRNRRHPMPKPREGLVGGLNPIQACRETCVAESADEPALALTHDTADIYEYTEATQPDAKYTGVRGWLLLFCVILTVVSPLTNAFVFLFGLKQAEPLVAQLPGLRTVLQIDGILIMGIVISSFYAGISLWCRRPNAVETAKAYLGLLLGVALVRAFLFPLIAGVPAEAVGQAIRQGMRQVACSYAFYNLWTSYLNRSKRVKATYGLHPSLP